MQGQYQPMQSTHGNSAIMQARQKPFVDPFSSKALVDFQPYQSVDQFSNPILLKTTSEPRHITDEPKRLMPRFPEKQG